MKIKIKKIIILMILFMILFTNTVPIMSYANNTQTPGTQITSELDDSNLNNNANPLLFALDGIVGLLTWVLRVPIISAGYAIQTIISQFVTGGPSGYGAMISAEDIIFSGSSRPQQVDLLDINFFDLSPSSSKSFVLTFREGVAKWYFFLRNIAIALSLVVLIYIGIRMAISSLASDQAKYKQMLKDWFVGFVVLILLHYFMVLIINLNNDLVDIIYQASAPTKSTSDYSNDLYWDCWHPSAIRGWGALLVYIFLLGTTISLFIMYVKRLFTIGFLIVISPLITVTYSIDKLGDGKSQALGTWTKEFVYNILIQPFHCIIYMVLVSSALEAIENSNHQLSALVFAIFSVLFILKAEGIVKNIFGIQTENGAGGLLAAGALAASTIGKMVPSKKGGGAAHAAGEVAGDAAASASQISRIDRSKSNAFRNSGGSGGSGGSGSGGGVMSRIRNSATAQAVANFGRNAGHAISNAAQHPLQFAKQLSIRELALAMKLTPKFLAGGATAGATGDLFKGAIVGYAVTNGRFTRKLITPLDREVNDYDQHGRPARELSGLIENYKMANPTLDDKEIEKKIKKLLDVDISSLTDLNERILAEKLQQIKNAYKNAGEADPKAKVMDIYKDIMNRAKDNKPMNDDFNVSLDKLKKATINFKSSTSLSETEVKSKASEVLNDINSNGTDYLKSSNYKNYDASEKEFAKKVYKTKQMLSAIGDVSDADVDRKINEAVDNAFRS